MLLSRCLNRSHENEGADSYGRSLFRGVAEWAVPTEHCYDSGEACWSSRVVRLLEAI